MVKKGNTTKKRPAPWAIRGVTAEARNAATTSARREGLTLGEWIDRAIRDQVKNARHEVPAPTLEDTLVKLTETLQKQNERLEAIENRKGWLSRLFGR